MSHPEPSATGESRVLRVGVVGIGQRAAIARHVEMAATDAAVVAAVDTSAEGRARVADLLGASVEVFSTLDDFIANAGVDAAIVTTPDWTHAEVAITLLRAGIAVYLEKPLAITLEDCDAVLEAATDTGTPLYVGHNFRHAAVVRVMRDIIARGEIGEVKTIWCRHFVGNGGDYYFKDWHADRSRVNSLLLQKASHDLDIIHMLAGAYTKRVVGMGELMVYGDITDRADRTGQVMHDWFSFDNWPPASLTGLNPVVDVEDVSMVMMTLENGVLASYEQAHFAPDYWRNYTVIGTEGRLENFGDTGGGVVKVWNRRSGWREAGDLEYPIDGVETGHADADFLTVSEFLDHVVNGTELSVSPVAARQAVAAGALATQSLRAGSVPLDVPSLQPKIESYFSHLPGAATS
ncbi:MAG TPA: Gfo/Idh/MocA family oxidoreductase [Galbitalea sp.]|jgi:predicted dehydrogenase